jgi:hypothetical protein
LGIVALVGLVLAAFFLLYLAPGRRFASLVILGEASIIGFFILWACYGFSSAVFSAAFDAAPQVGPSLHTLSVPFLAVLPMLALFIISVLVFISWPRTRYFGNWAPLLVFLLLAHLRFAGQQSFIWALPFLFVFIGGIFADLFETRWYPVAAAVVVLAIVAQQALVFSSLLRVQH